MAICKRSHLCQTIVLGIHVKFWEGYVCDSLPGHFPLSFPLRGWYGPGQRLVRLKIRLKNSQDPHVFLGKLL